ncbi:MAG: GntR family transcriptional regulator [Rhodothermales bacterium]
MPATLQPIKDGSLKTQVFHTLREAIFTGTFQGGDALREAHLARDLSVSQATVREALVGLEHVGLVVRVPNKGTYVARLTATEVRERLAIRARLEEMAWLEAAPRMTPRHFDKLGEYLSAIAEAIESNAYFEEAQADLDFHRYIWRQSGNETLYGLLNQLTIPLFSFVGIKRGRSQETLKEVVASHESVVKALQSRDPATIKRVLDQHLELFQAIPEPALDGPDPAKRERAARA